ncbi:MAG: hypothetical protein AAGC95_00980 [Pseudomonadota bacterium]
MRLLLSIFLLVNMSSAAAQELACPDEYFVLACRAPLAFKVTGRFNSAERSGGFTILDLDELYELNFQRGVLVDGAPRQFKNGECTFLDRPVRDTEPNVLQFSYVSANYLDVNKLVIDEVMRCNSIPGCQFRMCVKSDGGVLDAELSSAVIKPGG